MSMFGAIIPAQRVATYKMRLLPTRAQHRALERICEDQRVLYNAALQERVEAYRKCGKAINYYDQQLGLKECRKAIPEMANIASNIQRGTLRRLDAAFSGFFKRVKAGEKAGHPRFKGKGWWDSFAFDTWNAIRFDGRRIRFKGMPSGLRVHVHRALPGSKPLSCQFRRDHKGWHVCIQYRVGCEPLPETCASIGVDVGITHFAALSSGETIPNPRAAKRAQRELRRRQRHMARCKKGSNGRHKARAQVARLHAKVANQRKTFHRQLAARLVRENDLISVEDLNVKGLARSMLAKEVHDAGWSMFIGALANAAERACRKLVKVDARYTSQTCPSCGSIKPKTLSERMHRCDCGFEADRDVAAAQVILMRAVVGPRLAKLPVAAA